MKLEPNHRASASTPGIRCVHVSDVIGLARESFVASPGYYNHCCCLGRPEASWSGNPNLPRSFFPGNPSAIFQDRPGLNQPSSGCIFRVGNSYAIGVLLK